jgi:hypothetical protein
MSNLTLGLKPKTMTLDLARGGDFNAALECVNEAGTPTNWPMGTAVVLRLGGLLDWDASISGARAVWSVDKVDVEAAYNAGYFTFGLYLINGTTEQLYAKGPVNYG